MTFKMKGWSGYRNSPVKHKTVSPEGVVTHGGGPHSHRSRPETGNTGSYLSDEEMVKKDASGKLDYYIGYEKEKEKKTPEGSKIIKSGDTEYVYTPPKKKKKKKRKKGTVVSRLVKKVFKKRGKRRGKRKTKNLVTGGTNIIEG